MPSPIRVSRVDGPAGDGGHAQLALPKCLFRCRVTKSLHRLAILQFNLAAVREMLREWSATVQTPLLSRGEGRVRVVPKQRLPAGRILEEELPPDCSSESRQELFMLAMGSGSGLQLAPHDRKGGEQIMSLRMSRAMAEGLLVATSLMTTGCARTREAAASPSPDPNLRGVAASRSPRSCSRSPEGAIFQRQMYNYATILMYQVIQVHRGSVKGQIIFVGHYNPFKPRAEAADQRVPDIGGNLKSFAPGSSRMALEGSMIDHFSGGSSTGTAGWTLTDYWAVWTDLVSD